MILCKFTDVTFAALALTWAAGAQPGPIKLPSDRPIKQMKFDAGSIFTLDDQGWLTKIDLKTGSQDARPFIGATRFATAGDAYWVGYTDGHVDELSWILRGQ